MKAKLVASAALAAALAVACGGSPRSSSREPPAPPTNGGEAAHPDAGSPPPATPKMSGKIMGFDKAKEHLRVDKVGSKDGDLEPDGIFDHVYELDLDGPADAIFVVSTDDQGQPNGDFAVDTLVALEPVPQAVAALGALGKHTGGLGVFEGGARRSAPDGHLPALAPGKHTLAVHLSGKDVPKTGAFRIFVRFTDGSVVSGPVAQPR